MKKIQSFSHLDAIQQTSEVQYSTNSVLILETSNGLKIVNPVTKETKLISFAQEQITFDWLAYFDIFQKGQSQKISVIIMMGDGSKLLLYGDLKQLTSIYEQTVGKYVFQKGSIYVEIRNLMKDDYSEIRIVINKYTGIKYYEKIILSETISVQESSLTLGNESTLPEEIQIVLDLQRTPAPHLLRVDSVLYDGVHYSYIYSGQKNLIRLIQYYNSIKQGQQYFLVNIAKQLLELMLVLEEKSIVFPNLNHQSLFVNSETNDLILTNYNQAFYCDKILFVRKCAILGYAPPEYFQPQTQVTSKANIFQVGVILYYLQFGHSPYGIQQQEIMQNTLRNKLDASQLLTKNNVFFNFIKLLLQLNQAQRPTAQESLKHSIFTLEPALNKPQISFTLNNSLYPFVDEFQTFNKISNIQNVKSKVVIIKKKK